MKTPLLLWPTVAAIASLLFGCASTPQAPDQPLGQATFVLPQGNWIGVEVSLGEKRRMMMLDTGATLSLFPEDFRDELGNPAYQSELYFGDNVESVPSDVFRARGGQVGAMSIDRRIDIALVDFPPDYKLKRHDLHGILSGNVFDNRTLVIWYESNVLQVFKSARAFVNAWGPAIPFVADRGDRKAIRYPHVTATLPDGSSAVFGVDTGAAWDLVLDKAIFDRLAERGDIVGIKDTGSELSQYSGSSRRFGTLSRFEVGGARQINLKVGDSAGANLIGNRFLSRYNVALDYKGKRLFLNPRPVWLWIAELEEDFLSGSKRDAVEFARVDGRGEAYTMLRGSDGAFTRTEGAGTLAGVENLSIEVLHDNVGSAVRRVHEERDAKGDLLRRETRFVGYHFGAPDFAAAAAGMLEELENAGP